MMKIMMKTIIEGLATVSWVSWVTIAILLFIILRPSFREIAMKNQKKPYKRFIESKKDKWDKVADILFQITLIILMWAFGWLIVYLVPDMVINGLIKWYKEIFGVTVLSVVCDWIKEKKVKSVWKITFCIYTVVLSIICYVVDMEKIGKNLHERQILNILIALFVVLFVRTLYEIYKRNRRQYSVKNLSKGIRKDLYRRTSEIDIGVSNNELIKGSEKYFDEYLHRCNKIKDLHTIEYVYLSGKYKKKWCNRIIQVMKGFVWESIIISMINIFYNEIRGLSIALGIIALVGISKFLISRSQQMDSEYVYVILIRLVYDDWGYYLTYADNKNKFVGTVQMIELSKYHKYVHSFLDIVALCRAVAINDQLEGTNRMSIITSNLSELFEDYSDDGDCKQDRNWVTLIPLWAATLFEFSVTGTVNADAKPVLLEYADASARFDISMFLQSFWADMKRKELSDGVAEFVQAFEGELYKVEA